MPTTTTKKPRGPRRPNAKFLAKEPSPTHASFAEWIEKTTGHSVPVGDVALVQRLYPEYLKSPAVVQAREAEKAARDKAAKEKEEAKRARAQARLDALNAQREKLLKELGMSEIPALSVVQESTDDADESDEDESVAPSITLDADESEDGWEEPDADESDEDESDADESDEDDDEWNDDEEEEDF